MAQDELIFGYHAVRAALKYDPAHIEEAWLDRGRKDRRLRQLAEQLGRLGAPVHQVSGKELERLVVDAHHQGVVVRYRGPAPRDEGELAALLDALDGPALLLVLDQIQDPHNLGACLRSADGAGVHAVIAPRDNAVGLTPTVHKVASGAAQSVPFFQVTNLARCLKQLKDRGVWLVGLADSEDSSLYQVDLTGPVAIVMGAEERGLRRLTREACDFRAHLPMAGKVPSLNVSVATGIALYEAVRQRSR